MSACWVRARRDPGSNRTRPLLASEGRSDGPGTHPGYEAASLDAPSATAPTNFPSPKRS